LRSARQKSYKANQLHATLSAIPNKKYLPDSTIYRLFVLRLATLEDFSGQSNVADITLKQKNQYHIEIPARAALTQHGHYVLHLTKPHTITRKYSKN